ncbi:FtsK/SpoIIIE domain-containing protein [Cellulomonas wangsupingiae]|uniref:FtsK/SpoIIIE domain-containing protein n=1 Tax=Cellulomonas wangsupingiae TaxID=2968085 RepID=A0ABY5KAM7_9CELL|nr:FtsK/SpoIIIE domain-containing protein [Cellulomonas wangsupingiae]MCC2334540.1 FHA domain-containing protein [Cellulomonas wangsupingiae]UUI66491.1 FtsK/SpoIIIE domain-containing protein [Cellulomonas wangsupingiae]
MRTRLTYRRAAPGGAVDVDVVVTADAGAIVADVADALVRAERAAGNVVTGEVTLALAPPDGGAPRTLPRRAGLAEAGLRAGSTVGLTPADEGAPGTGVAPQDAHARLTVVSGPQAGLEVHLPRGTTTVGRGPHSDVRLTDPLVSTTHARVVVGDTVEVVDAGSSNGVVIGWGRVDRATVGPRDYVVLGETILTLTRVRPADGSGDGAAVVAFNRSPRVVPVHPERTVEAPAPPEPGRPGRFPVVALAAPVVLGAVLYALVPRPTTLVLLALSPLLLIAGWVDKRFSERRRLREETAAFRASLAALEQDLAAGAQDERRVRLGELASTAQAVRAARDLGPTLWSRRPRDPAFLALRPGVGTSASRTTVRLPPRGRAGAEHWAMVEALRDRFADVDGVPVEVSLRAAGAVGVAGPRAEVDDVARALVAQLVCLHAPSELVVTGLASSSSRDRWDWLKWLPHVASPHSPLLGPHLAADPTTSTAVVTALEELVAARRAPGRHGEQAQPAVLLVVEDDAQAERGRLVRLAEDGPDVGVHVLWCAAQVEQLPAACRAFLAVTATGVRVGRTGDGRWDDVVCERLDVAAATDLARRLAAVVDDGAPVVDESDLPRSVGQLSLLGAEVADDPEAVVARWRETGSILARTGTPVRRRGDAGLRAVVGQGSTGRFVLDLRAQGPHALVGGTTGSGKSEFLQSWVLGLATAHSPDRVTFLFVDYKGGAAFADCVDLPHAVGLVTDLSPHLVRRALVSLRAELRRREHLLQRKGVKDLLALERSGDPQTPPSLVIVVDEFAALAADVPQFVDGVVDVAQRGRSLGLHLVLATQRPAGVIKDNLRANTNLRVALRMADEADSADVLGTPLAAGFDPAVPGRGAVRTGPGRLALFQAGYAGGRSRTTTPRVAVGLESLEFGPGEPWDVPLAPDGVPVDDDGPTDLARTVRNLRAAARAEAIPPPRRPWLPELPAVRAHEEVVDPGQTGLVLGVVDRPARQEQHPWVWDPDAEGSLVVLGTSGAGKSATLRTLAVSAALGALGAGGPVHVHGLDLGSGGLAMLDELPVVGSVVDGADTERVQRLMRTLRDALDERATRYAAVRAGSLTDYRALTGRADEPRLLLLLDGLAAFREAHEADPGRTGAWSVLQRLVAEGRPLGVHVAMSAERPGALPTSLAGSVARRLVLRQADEGAYGVLDVPRDVLGPASPPGRGVFAGETDEVQVAVPGGRAAPAEQAAAVAAVARRLRAAGVAATPPVRRLPTVVAASSLPATVDGLPVLGVADDTLQPCGFAPRGTFLLAGMPGSGRTTALVALGDALRRALPAAPLYYVGARRSPVRERVAWTATAGTPEQIATLARDLLPELGAAPADGAPVVLVVEAIADLLGGPAEQALTEAVRTARRNDHFVLAESETSTWGSSWPLVAEVRNGRRGLVLQPDHLDGDALFRTTFPRTGRAEFPPGRGVLVEHGRLRRVQLPVAD